MRVFEKLIHAFPKDRTTRIILGVLLVLALFGSIFAFRIIRYVVSTNQTFSLPGDPLINALPSTEGDDPDDLSAIGFAPSANLPTPEPWDGVSRVNLLLMGLDYRDWEAGETPRTDTMIVLTFDPLSDTAGMLSVPRDLWVPIPGFEYNKINTAYYLGEIYNLPGGGPGLAMKTIEELLGIPIQYYAQIDFQAFVDFINHIDGVRLTFDEPMVLDRRGKWNTVTIEPGIVTLSGEYALAYVRSRAGEGGDFGRAQRQQHFIMAVRDRILEFDMMPKLVANAPQIYNDIAAGVHTNMSVNEVIKLAWSALDLDRDAIKTLVISNEYTSMAESEDGLEILRPIPDKIRLLRDEVFGTGDLLGPASRGEIGEIIAEEGARVSVRNGSSHTGLAAQTAEWLRTQGFNVVEETSAEYTVYSQIYIYGGTPYAMKFLAEASGISEMNIHYNDEADVGFDIIFIMGDDWANNNPMP
ncbi:MAG: LCP family protein [Chloroflexi bacterium]|nr:LCP family protein [Chloroflexota bacterium]